MDKILSFEHQQAVKPCSVNNIEEWTQFRNEVVRSELRRLLGPVMAANITAAPENYTDLLEGDTLDYCGSEIKHAGLRFVLAYMVYARYVTEQHLKDTFTGIVKKVRSEAESAGEGELRRLERGALQIANDEFVLIDMYLCQNATLYPDYKKNIKSPSRGKKIFEPIRRV
jgi:hypothetical protein